jgi:hypothetical protein
MPDDDAPRASPRATQRELPRVRPPERPEHEGWARPATTPRTRPSRLGGTSRLDLTVLAVIALLGAIRLTVPFTGDQALFTIGAREIRHGAVLYRDFWDIKQPAIFLFYLAGGALGGFNEVAIHALELVTLLGFSILLQRTARRYLNPSWVASLLPLAVVGVYYASARPLELTQVESLIGIPLYVSVWLAIRALDGPEHRRVRLVGSGVAAGIAGALKLVCIPLVGPAWAFAAITLACRAPRRRVRAALSSIGSVAVGLAIPLAAMAAYFAAYGLTHEVLWTYFTYTPKTTGIAGRPVSRLTDSITRFAAFGAPVLLLATVGVGRTIRRGWDAWSIAFAGWLAIGVPVFLGQHWWAYQLALFFVPVAYFAARGVEAIVVAWPRLRRSLAVAIAGTLLISVAPLAISFGRGATIAARHGFGITRAGRTALQDAEQPQYVTGRDFARFVRAHAPGAAPIFVLGNPIDLYETARDQAIPTNGWAAEQYDATAWHRITVGLDDARPPVLAVDDFSARYIAARSPATRALIDRLYVACRHVDTETWYVLRRPGAAC